MESIQEFRLRLRLIRKHVDTACFLEVLKKQQAEAKKLCGLLERVVAVMEKEHGIKPKRGGV